MSGRSHSWILYDRVMAVLDDIRAAAADVTTRARWVTIDRDRLVDYATALQIDHDDSGDPARVRLADEPSTALFVLALNAINFGSGYFPWLKKLPGQSGYHTVATRFRSWFEAEAPDANELRRLDATACTAMMGQIGEGPAGELMAHFAVALNDLGAAVAASTGIVPYLRRAEGSAEVLVEQLDRVGYFRDVWTHGGRPVPIYKRAQIAAYDLHVAFDGGGLGRFDDIGRLTMFADNLVPHVLRIDGVLNFDGDLVRRIDAVDDITAGSEPEVEIRAVALHAVEEIVKQRGDATAGEVDGVLWRRGADERYRAVARHRTRTTAY